MKIHCPHCNSLYNLPENYEGKNAKCKDCQKQFIVHQVKPTTEKSEVPLPSVKVENNSTTQTGDKSDQPPSSDVTAVKNEQDKRKVAHTEYKEVSDLPEMSIAEFFKGMGRLEVVIGVILIIAAAGNVDDPMELVLWGVGLLASSISSFAIYAIFSAISRNTFETHRLRLQQEFFNTKLLGKICGESAKVSPNEDKKLL
jgi:hypothetical protein